MGTKKIFWHRIDKGVESITLVHAGKITSKTPMVYGQLAEMICDHCNIPKPRIDRPFSQKNRKITVTIK